jgi:hypothetical protein
MYFYNGAGVGAGDFNNDGFIDLFFSSNQGENKLYLNEGNLHFKDVTNQTKIPQDGGWSTGVSVVDINNDGLLDIYVCRVGNFEILKGKNQFLICHGIDKNGIPYYEDKAADYGLDFSGFSTQAAFLDYDIDGDLDMFLLNHSVHQNGTFGERKNFLGTYHPLTGDRLYRNNLSTSARTEGATSFDSSSNLEGKFTDVTKKSGINSSAIGYGLGIAISDINLDGYPDIYVGNDFHENDYLYINQQNGTFKEQLTEQIMHTSQFSMGVDIADLNNDAFPEIITVDMLPSDPYILKRSLGEDEYNLFNMKIHYGYNHQYAKNTLQLNRKNGMFSEVAMYSGVFATDWSWAPLFLDFDNDGLKDLFVSNGIPKRLNDMDYVSYISNDEVQGKIKSNQVDEKEMAVINKFPEIKLPNRFFKNKGNAVFDDIEQSLSGNTKTFSNGAVYADLDNDGDLDIVVNNIDEPVLLYENKTTNNSNASFLQIKLNGSANNKNAIGSRVIVYAKNEVRTYEKYPVKGFQSSMETPLHIGLANTQVDSMILIWPDNTYQNILLQNDTSHLTITYNQNLPSFDYNTLNKYDSSKTAPVTDVTSEVGLTFLHEENPFVEFDREPLIPFMVSREGPALAVGDLNSDGLEDVFLGSSKGKKSAVFFQLPNGKFNRSTQINIDKDSTYEDVDAVVIDVNNDSFNDLVIASGGNEYYGNTEYLTPRVYVNDGKGNFNRSQNSFPTLTVTTSCITANDFNNDGSVDFFISGRAVPWEYGQIPQSYLFQNNGTGKFINVTDKNAKELSNVGFVKHAQWFDIDKDGDSDLLLSLEWGGICAFINDKGLFRKKMLTDKNGWWNFTLPVDVDADGDVDLIAGNLGLNNRLKSSDKQPVKLYYNDFDGNGKKEQVLTYYLEGKEIPFANKDELQKQMPLIKKKFLYAENFAKASFNDLFTTQKIRQADVLTANYFSNVLLINDGKMNFTPQPLPWKAQLSSFKDAVVVNANNDNLPDLALFGNFYESNVQMGRYDADFGSLLINSGNGNFSYSGLNGLQVKGQVRHVRRITIANKECYILAKNNDSLQVIQFNR